MLVIERTAGTAAAVEVEQPERAGPSPSRTRMWPVLAMAAGLVLVGAALAVIHHSRASGAAPAPAPSGITLGGPADVTVQTTTYEAGHSSGWHSHTGMHAVLILSGTVTFYDSQCQGRTYGPGETYVGGQEIHVARNDTVAPVEMAVTYLFPTGRPHTTFHVASPAPAGCDIR